MRASRVPVLALVLLLGACSPRDGQAQSNSPGTSSSGANLPAANRAPPANAATMKVSFAPVVQRAAPAVVNISARRLVRQQTDPFWSLFGLGVPQARLAASLGSGVIVREDGIVVTNNHVVENGQEITIGLNDRREFPARILLADPRTDLAVLKVELPPGERLPVLAIDDSGDTQVGDLVLAIGNPFGIGQTVTMGIVSALQRQLALSPYEDFIQTDAAINSGNSGGALVNAEGQLVGINTAMLEHDTGAQGIGFAIPVRTAKRVLEQIVEQGHVSRGWLGVEVGNVVVSADSGLPAAARGATVVDVYPGGPAAQAGLQPGDILLKVDKQPIIDSADLRAREAETKPGTRVAVSGLRAGEPFHAEVVLAQRPSLRQTGARG